jgi:ABC-2 type transport system ATP-binding protein
VTAALELRDLHFGYGRAAAVRSVSLTLQPGDCYGFLGHNGAGKTTVLRLALGLLRPSRGSVHVFGIDALRDPVTAHAQVGALVERPGFHLHLSARANLRALARLQGLPRALAAAETERVLDLLGLAAAADRKVAAFSLGMRQRLGIAQAVLGRPRLLLLDEPTNGLDPEGIADLRAVLRRLVQEEGTAVLLSSHQLAELDGLCNRIGVLRDGAMVVEGDLAWLRDQLRPQHRLRGTPLDALAAQLQQRGMASERLGDELRFELGAREPSQLLRELLVHGDVRAFAPEPVTMEALYLRAAELQSQPPAAIAPAVPTHSPAHAPMGHATWPRLRAFAHELRLLRLQKSTFALALLPALLAAWRVFAHHRHVQHNLARVGRGELFSADAGSGHLATALALQQALPLLALCLIWLASQSLAADLHGDTLRNTLLRAVRRGHVVLGKLLALTVVAAIAYALLVATTLATAGALFGFGDLEEVSKNGDRQVLADARDVGGVLLRTLLCAAWPLPALLATSLAASALARRPARALVFAAALVLLPELFRERLRDHAGWLLTSHLPIGLRDDSVLGWFGALARGAADALWPWQASALTAPLCWLATGFVATVLQVRRLRLA